jgi:dihydrofolate reductase
MERRYKSGTLKLHLTAIVAMTPDRVIGRAGTLPWHLPEDLAFFKRVTSGHPIVMGRKTFESIGRPLPKRRNIVLTRDRTWSAPGVEVIHGPEELKELPGLEGRVFVIGGSEIYAAFLPVLDDLLVSHVFAEHEGDTRFPEFEDGFPESELVETHGAFEVRRWWKGTSNIER